MTLVWILLAFLGFSVIIWSAHAVDEYASARYGYAPFAMPNLLFMSIPSGLLLLAIRDGGEQTQLLVTLAGAAMLGMLLLVRARTSGWIALYASPMMLLCAPVLLFSVLFRSLARAGRSEEETRQAAKGRGGPDKRPGA